MLLCGASVVDVDKGRGKHAHESLNNASTDGVSLNRRKVGFHQRQMTLQKSECRCGSKGWEAASFSQQQSSFLFLSHFLVWPENEGRNNDISEVQFPAR